MSSSDVRLPGFPGAARRCLVLGGAGFQASVEDADEPVGELAQGRRYALTTGVGLTLCISSQTTYGR
jgi:hypothetical protein